MDEGMKGVGSMAKFAMEAKEVEACSERARH
jgi:hypothetical protein